jgi:hypothetical protein
VEKELPSRDHAGQVGERAEAASGWLQREFGAEFQRESGVWISVNERAGGSSQQAHEV